MTGTPYHAIRELRDYYFEDSYVLAIHVSGDSLAFDLDVVLMESHPEHHAPLPNEQYCYRRGRLEFPRPARNQFLDAGVLVPALDATGELDLGNLDVIELAPRRYRISGEWGVIETESELPSVTLAADDIPAP